MSTSCSGTMLRKQHLRRLYSFHSCAHLTSTPVCTSSLGGTCVQCLADSDCPLAAAAQCSGSDTCVACNASSHCSHLTSIPVCNTSSGACVQCLVDSDCPSATTSHCSGSNTSVACTASSQCTHLTSTLVCISSSG